jgi:hypothetical protein
VVAAAPLLVYLGHHKCASSWLSDIVRETCAASGLVYAHVHNARMFDGDLQAFVSRGRIDFVAYANANMRYISRLQNVRGFHVIRDPRDIVVSSYFSHLHSHPTTGWPELVEHRRQLQQVDKERGLYVVIDFLQDVLEDIATWDYDDPRILELKMEDVVRAPDELLVKALAFLGVVDGARTRTAGVVAAALATARRRHQRLVPFRVLPLPVSVVRDIVRRNAFARKAHGRRPGVEAVGSHYRKGVPGDWANHFGAGHRAYFKDRYGDLLIRLGYEAGLDW